MVAGCGGDRDREKRPAIGGALAMADTAIFMADNPRSEDPDAIAAAMLRGVQPVRRPHVQVELDRRGAIERAGRLARPGDVILLLGKGHETVQQIGTTKQPWDDAAQLRAALNEEMLSSPGEAYRSASEQRCDSTSRFASQRQRPNQMFRTRNGKPGVRVWPRKSPNSWSTQSQRNSR